MIANYIVSILRSNCLNHDATEGHMMEVKGVGRRKQLLDYLRNKIYWELKVKKSEHKEEIQVVSSWSPRTSY